MNRNTNLARIPTGPARQTGVALMVVLILLVLMTLLALVSLRGTLMQERMSSNQYDRSLGFQSAEAALREAEAIANNDKPQPAADSGCAKGVCSTPDPKDTPRWLDEANWNVLSTAAVDNDLKLAIPARYIIEYMGLFPGKNCTTSGDVSETGCTTLERHYRITARSRDSDRADVTLQSNFAVP